LQTALSSIEEKTINGWEAHLIALLKEVPLAKYKTAKGSCWRG
jgi:hypothetical protein